MTNLNEKPSVDDAPKGLKRIPWPLKLVGGIVILTILLMAVGAILIVADPVDKVNAVVVLSGDDGDRLDLALYMLEKDFVSSLILTNTNNTANAALRQEAIDGGFSPSRISLTSDRVDSTVEEAEAVRALVEGKHWSDLMVVTDPYHSLRTRLIFRDVFAGTGITIRVRPVAGHWFRSTTWFLRPEGWRMAGLEVLKVISYLFGVY
ncbi:YdcF family protein [bacterium]|nr:YdcF family protein [bacterium]